MLTFKTTKISVEQRRQRPEGREFYLDLTTTNNLFKFNNNGVINCYLLGGEEEAKTSSSFNCGRMPARINNTEIQYQQNAQAVMRSPTLLTLWSGGEIIYGKEKKSVLGGSRDLTIPSKL